MVRKKKVDSNYFVSVSENKNEFMFGKFFATFFQELFAELTTFVEAVKVQSVLLCFFSSLALFLLAWLLNPVIYLVFFPVFLFSIFHSVAEYKWYVLRKDFDENGIF